MIGLLGENQFQLKMMGLKDTFSWEILHPLCSGLFPCHCHTQVLYVSPCSLQIAMKIFPVLDCEAK